MKKLFFVITFVFVACANSHDSRSDEPENNNPPSYDNPLPSEPAANNPGEQEKEKAKEPVEEDGYHDVRIIFSDDGVPFLCFRDGGMPDALKNSGFKYYYEGRNGKTVKTHSMLLKVIGLTRLDCCLINKRRLNHLTGKFEMTAGRLARAKKECAAALQKEEDDLKKVKAEEEDDKEQDETNEPDDGQNE